MKPRTDPAEFKRFDTELMKGAPADYIPWYFPLIAGAKDPDGIAISKRAPPTPPCCKGAEWVRDPKQNNAWACSGCKTKRGSWKAPWARLTPEEAVDRLGGGSNVGIAGMPGDGLLVVDIDNEEKTPFETVKKTLAVRSRKRRGYHFFYFRGAGPKIGIVPTDNDGEIRTEGAYVVACGSHAPVTAEELTQIPEADRPNAGKYSLELAMPPASITLGELPEIFLTRLAVLEGGNRERTELATPFVPHPTISPLYTLAWEAVLPGAPRGRRFPHPTHDSDTGTNFFISGGLAHCWRCGVSLSPVQFLAVKYGLLSCGEAGVAHGGGRGSKVGPEIVAKIWPLAVRDGLVKAEDRKPAAIRKGENGVVLVVVEGLGTFKVSRGGDPRMIRLEVENRAFMDVRPMRFWEGHGATKSMISRAFPELEKGEREGKVVLFQRAFEEALPRLCKILYKNGDEGKEEVTQGSEAIPPEVEEKAQALLNGDLDFLNTVSNVLGQGIAVSTDEDRIRFVLGEEGKKLLVFCNLAGSISTPYPQMTLIVGAPGQGKSNLPETIMHLLPEGKVRRRGYLTGAAIRYGESDKDSIIYLQEFMGKGEMELRLLSPYDGGFVAEVAAKDPETGAMTTQTYDVKCRGFISTTAEGLPSLQLLRRVWLISADETEELTTEINKAKALIREGNWIPSDPVLVAGIKRAVSLITPRKVRIPFASVVAAAYSWDRSTIDRVFDLVAILANFYQRQRPINEKGEIMALPWDYFRALDISEAVLLETISKLPKGRKDVLDAVVSAIEDNISKKEGKYTKQGSFNDNNGEDRQEIRIEDCLPTAKEITKKTGLDQKTVYNYCRDLINLGYLTGTSGKPKKYEPTKKAQKLSPMALRDNIKASDIASRTWDSLRLMYSQPCDQVYPPLQIYEKWIDQEKFVGGSPPPEKVRTLPTEPPATPEHGVVGGGKALKEIGIEQHLSQAKRAEYLLSIIKRLFQEGGGVKVPIAKVEGEAVEVVGYEEARAGIRQLDKDGFILWEEGAVRPI